MTPDFLEPSYGERSLGDVLPAMVAAMGVEAGLGPSSLEFPGASRYVLFLVDGLGHELLRDHPEEAPYLHSLLEAQAGPSTSAVPSTTATSLTSLGTALPPGAHGVIGYSARIPGTERLLNALQWDSRVDPREWQPHPTAFDRIAAAGVSTTVVNRRSFESSGLSVAGSRGARFVGADKVGERLAAVVEASAESPSITYMYDGDLDWTGHAHGVASPQWEQELAMIDAAAEQLRESLPDDVRVVVVADHGMVDCPADHRVDVEDHPPLREGVFLVGGEARFRQLYCRSGAVDDVLATWTETLGDRALVLSRDGAVERGWFGETEARVRPRLGDVLVASRGDHAVLDRAAFPKEGRMTGMHGSLTAAEMLVPVLVS
jgi:hypothetical protein